MKRKTKSHFLLYSPLVIGLSWMVWWIFINFFGYEGSRDNFTDTYSLVALIGSVVGLIVAKKWGGFSSRFGKSIAFFAIGLGLQFLGQLIYGYYFRVLDVELAYPSIGDIPYLLSNVMYVLAVINILRVITPVGSFLKPLKVLVTSLVMSLGVLAAMYFGFLHLAAQDERGLIFQVVNIAYPLIQSVYFLFGLIALLQARRIAGGKMFWAVFVLLIALVVQYSADFMFLYQSYHDTWEAARLNDLIFVSAYTLMVLSILMINQVRLQLTSSNSEAGNNE